MTSIKNVTLFDRSTIFRATNEAKHDHDVVDGFHCPDTQLLGLEHLPEQRRVRTYEHLAMQRRLSGLLRANAAAAADLALPALLRHIVDAAKGLLRARYAAVVVLDSDGKVQQFVHAGIDQDLATHLRSLPDGQCILDLLTRGTEPVESTEPTTGARRGPPVHRAVGGFLGVPIQVGREILGNLYLGATSSSIFTIEDEELVTALAATAGVAIANARLLRESEQRRRWLTASSQLTNELLAADTVQRLTCVSQAVMTTADADLAIISVAQGADERVAAATGDSADELLGRTTPMDCSAAASTIQVGMPVLLTDCRPGAAVADDHAAIRGPTMIVPLSAGNHIRGAITIGRRSGREAFTDADLDMAVSFGKQAAVALALAETRDVQISDARLDDHERIAFDMHDHVIGELFAVGMGLQGLATATLDPAHVKRITKYVDSLDHVISTIRTAVFQLQPRRHDPAGLQTRLLGIADAHTDQLGYRPQLHFTGPLDHLVGEPLAVDVLAVTREALSNCARHARASAVTVSVGLAGEVLTVEITDNGAGMGATTRSSGLSNLRHRAEDQGGTFLVSPASGGGTRLTWSAVLTAPAARAVVGAAG